MRWLRAPDMFEPPGADILDALSLAQVARHFGSTPWELARQPAYWLYVGELEMEVAAELGRLPKNARQEIERGQQQQHDNQNVDVGQERKQA